MFSIIRRFAHSSTVQKIVALAQNKPKITLLNNPTVVTDVLNNNFENVAQRKNLKNVSGILGEKLVEELLILQNIKYKKQYAYQNIRPDFITENHIIEVKTTIRANKNYDLIMFRPFKYYNLAVRESKKIKIVLVGYDSTLFKQFRDTNLLFEKYLQLQRENNVEYVFYNNELINL